MITVTFVAIMLSIISTLGAAHASASSYPILASTCIIDVNQPNGRLVVLPKARESPPSSELVSSFAEDPNWAVYLTDAFPSDEVSDIEYTFTPYASELHTNGTVFLSMLESYGSGSGSGSGSGDDPDEEPLYDLCSWSIAMMDAYEFGSGEDPPLILRCTSTFSHGLYTFIVEEVGTNTDGETVVVSMTATYTQSGSALKYVADGAPGVKYMPAIAYFGVSCLDDDDDSNVSNITRVHKLGYQYSDISGTFAQDGPVTIVKSLPKSLTDGISLDDNNPSSNITILENPLDAGDWNIFHQTLNMNGVRLCIVHSL